MAGSSVSGGQPIQEIPATRGLDIVQSLVLLERNQLEEAERLIVKSLDMLGWGSWMELHGFVELARLRHALGNEAGVQEILQRMGRLGTQHAGCAEALHALFDAKRSLAEPQLRSRAEAWARAHVPNLKSQLALGIGPYHRDVEYICNLLWVWIQITLGHFDEASTFIIPALQLARECGLLYRIAELSIALALIHDGQGDLSAALEELDKALEISEACGYTRFFDYGPELDRLLQKAVEKKICAQYAKRLLISIQFTRGVQKTAAMIAKPERIHPDLFDPLSERELEVLRLLSDGLSPAEAAKKLFLSPFTLKAHTQNIYAKLGVHSHIEAINKAREMDFL